VIIIEDVIYGTIPIEKTLAFSIAPPENILNIFTISYIESFE
jgi:hypothetical protein